MTAFWVFLIIIAVVLVIAIGIYNRLIIDKLEESL